MALSKNKRTQVQLEKVLGDILDFPDSEILIVRGKGCEILYANSLARKRLEENGLLADSCKNGYAELFPNLCKHCPCGGEAAAALPARYEMRNSDGRFFSVITNTVDWLDGKSATLLLFRDIHEERNLQEQLYRLAYIDQLTNIPNRQKFKEDFEAIQPAILSGKKCGMIGIFDLDHFKDINDTYGHNTGDILLRRIAGHLKSDAAFEGHLYRLGGDEFSLIFDEPAGKFESREELHAYYQDLMKGAFSSYTMPMIDKECTISMGISFFPEHGTSSAELLRKADIALYHAKEAGRNQLVLFEDQYDSAEKFKDLFINIQPILRENGDTFGYELIDQSMDEKSEEENSINLAEFDRTIDALGLDDIENNARYMLSFSKQLFSPAVAKNLPKNKFIVQLDASRMNSLGGKKICEELKKYGYTLALSGVNSENFSPELIEAAGYCKFDAKSISQYNQKQIIAKYPKKIFIALDVDTADDFESAKKTGFKLFQGFFFRQDPPSTRKDKEIDPLKINYMRLIQLTSTDDFVDFKEISDIISSDVALSYKLLRLLNSAALGVRNRISSISMAVAYLGEKNLKQWIAMLALRGTASDKPIELIRVSLIRARFGELLAPHFPIKRDAKHVFLVGLLSLLHIAVEKSKEELFATLPVAEDISESILTNNGIHSDLLKFFSNYEYSNWDEVRRFAEEQHLSTELIHNSYMEAVKWYNQLFNAEK